MRLRLRPGPDRPPLPLGDGPVVLVLPARDEAARIGAVIDRLPADVLGRPTRCVVVDDGSTDDTVEVARSCGAIVVKHGTSRGLGRRRAHRAQGGDRASTPRPSRSATPTASTTPPRWPPSSSRSPPGAPTTSSGRGSPGRSDACCRTAGSATARSRSALRVVARAPITDGQSGYRALSARAAAECQIVHDYNYAQVLTLDVLARGFRYDEVPITLLVPRRRPLVRAPRPLPARRRAGRLARRPGVTGGGLTRHLDEGPAEVVVGVVGRRRAGRGRSRRPAARCTPRAARRRGGPGRRGTAAGGAGS